MAEVALQRTVFAMDGRRALTVVLAALVAAALLARLHLVFLLNVNWDEFFYLEKVYRYLGGQIAQPLQSFHVHVFTWLPRVGPNEVDQIVAARLGIYALFLGSTGLTYLIARHFLDMASALFAVLCYVSLSYAIEHGTSFRADPIAGFLFLVSVAALLRPAGGLVGPALAGLAAAAAVMITIKSMFYLPVLGAVLLVDFLPRARRGGASRRLAAFGCAFLAGFAALYLLHQGTLAGPTADAAVRLAGNSADKVIMLDRLFPRWAYLLRTLIDDAAIWVALLLGAAAIAGRVFRRADRLAPRLLLMSFLLPLATLAFYRNAFPYYYVFLLSPAVVLCGVAFGRVLPLRHRRELGRSHVLAAAFALAVALGHVQVYLEHLHDGTRLQRQTVALVHELFPEPVAYIDRTTTIASFPKVGFFMSTWGIENYRAAGVPVFRRLLVEERPPFLLADHAPIDPRIDQTALRTAGYALFDDDYRVLVDNYVHHWGDLFVAGKTLRLEGGAGLDFEILISGTYTLEAETAIEIDGRRLAPGKTVALAPGRHRAASPGGTAATAVLRWGNRLPRPRDPAPPGPLYTGF